MYLQLNNNHWRGKRFATIIALLLTLAILINVPGEVIRNIANLRQVTSIVSDQHSSESGASAYLQGVAAFHQGRYQQAIDHLSDTQAPKYAFTRWYLVQAYNRQGDWRKALQLIDLDIPHERQLYVTIVFDHLEELTPTEKQLLEVRVLQQFPDTIIQFASHLLSVGQYEQAREVALNIPNYSDSVEAQILVGQSLYYSRQFTDAEQTFQAAYARFPISTTAYWYGRLLAHNGKTREAIPYFEDAKQKLGIRNSTGLLLELSAAYLSIGECQRARTTLNPLFSSVPSARNIIPDTIQEKFLEQCGAKLVNP